MLVYKVVLVICVAVELSATESATGSSELSTADSATGSSELGTSDSATGSSELSTSDSATGSSELGTSDSATGSSELGTSDSATGSSELSTSDSATGSSELGTSDSATGSSELGTSDSATGSSELGTSDSIIDETSPEFQLNNRPIVGILSQELPRSLRKAFGNRTSYIAASYVKFVEMAGARVVPIRIYESEDYYNNLVSWLNGLVIPGGAAKLDGQGYGRASRIMWQAAARRSEVYFPIWGTCLGFEELTVLELGEKRLNRCSSKNQALPLNFTPGGLDSRMFSGANEKVKRTNQEQNVTINFHKYCLSLETFWNSTLSRDYDIIATNQDWLGQEFISAMEHKRRPVYGTQYHPEKNIFEWGIKSSINAIPHWQDAIAASQYLANFFISEVRKNNQMFPSPGLEAKQLIYNYKPENTAVTGSVFQQCYFLD